VIGCGGGASPPATDCSPSVSPRSVSTEVGAITSPVSIVVDAQNRFSGLVLPHEWESGAVRAAEELGCKRVIWQLRGEKFEQAVNIYARGYSTGDCLILEPYHGGADYFLGYAGQFEGRVTNNIPSKWPGVPVFYVSDNPLVVLTSGLVPEIPSPESEAGTFRPAHDLGCERFMWNTPGEQIKQTIVIHEPGYVRSDEADCLILPSSQEAREYFLPWVDGDKRQSAPEGCSNSHLQSVRDAPFWVSSRNGFQALKSGRITARFYSLELLL
jgi:hypothetical protein